MEIELLVEGVLDLYNGNKIYYIFMYKCIYFIVIYLVLLEVVD